MLTTTVRKFGYRLATIGQRRSLPKGYYSQFGQDRFVAEELLPGLQGGTFVDIGANDGVTFSNTFHFEKELGWRGVAFEPLPWAFEKLRLSRRCILVNGCVTDFDGETSFVACEGPTEMLSGIASKFDPEHMARIDAAMAEFGGARREITVRCYRLDGVLKANGISHVDYLSVDTEGGEFDILRSIDFRATPVSVITVENNTNTLNIRRLLEPAGFELVAVTGADEVYRHRDCR